MTDINNAEMQTVIERVKKLLALASNNPNENEAAAASAKAMKMLEDWNLDMATVETAGSKQAVERTDNKTFGGFYKWQTSLWTAVAKLNFCMYWRVETEGKNKQKRTSWAHRVLGRKENVVSTQVMAEYLQQTVERLAQARAKEQGIGPLSREIIAYREGMASRLVERLHDLRRQRLAEDEAKKQAAQAKYGAEHQTSSTAVVLQDVIQSEEDLNNDYLMGWEPGTTAARRAEQAARLAAYRAEWEAERQRQAEWDAAHPEEAAKRKAKEEAERAKADAAWERKWERSQSRNRKQTAEEQRRNLNEFWEGREVAEDIGLDQQLGEGAKRLK